MPTRKALHKTSHLLREARGVTAIGRHSIKGDTPSGLTLEGEAKAQWSGRNLPKGFFVSASSGNEPRHQTTAKRMVETFPGKKSMQVRVLEELGFQHVKDKQKMGEIMKNLGLAKALSKWIDGKIPQDIADTPEKTGAKILHYAIGETKKLMQSSPEKPFHLNVASSWIEAAILKVLGIDYRTIKPRKGRSRSPPKQGETLKETEALLFFHLPGGRTILSFRGRKFDVTKALAKF